MRTSDSIKWRKKLNAWRRCHFWFHFTITILWRKKSEFFSKWKERKTTTTNLAFNNASRAQRASWRKRIHTKDELIWSSNDIRWIRGVCLIEMEENSNNTEICCPKNTIHFHYHVVTLNMMIDFSLFLFWRSIFNNFFFSSFVSLQPWSIGNITTWNGFTP